MTKIGKPLRIIEVEPEEIPVEPEPVKEPEPVEPEKEPAKT